MSDSATIESKLRQVIALWRAEARSLRSDPADSDDVRDGRILDRICDRLEAMLCGKYP